MKAAFALISKYKRRIIIITIVVFGYLCYFGLPNYYFAPPCIYPGHPRPELNNRIEKLMSEIRRTDKDYKVRSRVESIRSKWSIGNKPLRETLMSLGLQAVPYIEEKTRSKDDNERIMAYQMLNCVTVSGTTSYYTSSADIPLKIKYVWPIWERALYDTDPNIRVGAIRNFRKKQYRYLSVRVFMRMMRDPDVEVRVQAARIVMWGYGRWYLVPIRLQQQAIHWEYE